MVARGPSHSTMYQKIVAEVPSRAQGIDQPIVGRVTGPNRLTLNYNDLTWLVVWLPFLKFSHRLGISHHPN